MHISYQHVHHGMYIIYMYAVLLKIQKQFEIFNTLTCFSRLIRNSCSVVLKTAAL
jgi:hypothetical protein